MEWTKSAGIPHLDFGRNVMPDAAAALGLGLIPRWGWETALPYHVAWDAKEQQKLLAHFDVGWNFTEESWDAMPWGPKSGLWELRQAADGTRVIVWQRWPDYAIANLPEKPVWDAVWEALRPVILDYHRFQRRRDMDRQITLYRDSIALAPAAVGGGAPFHVGGGLEHMPALIHALSAADNAGAEYGAAVLRTKDRASTAPLWTMAAAHELLGVLTRQTNEAESAYNIVKSKYDALIAPLLDAEKGGLTGTPTEAEVLAAREKSLAATIAFVDPDNLASEFKAAQDGLAALPADLPTLKAVLRERLEAAATGQQKRIKGALSQQAIDNWAACLEVDTALREVAVECAVGSQRVSVAADAEKAQAAFSAAVKAVAAVTPANIPDVTHAISGRRVTIRAVNPTVDPAIRGPVSVVSTGVSSTDGSTITGKVTASDGPPVKDSDPMLLRWDFADDYAGKVRIAVEVRNVCGPATYAVDLSVAAHGTISAA